MMTLKRSNFKMVSFFFNLIRLVKRKLSLINVKNFYWLKLSCFFINWNFFLFFDLYGCEIIIYEFWLAEFSNFFLFLIGLNFYSFVFSHWLKNVIYFVFSHEDVVQACKMLHGHFNGEKQLKQNQMVCIYPISLSGWWVRSIVIINVECEFLGRSANSQRVPWPQANSLSSTWYFRGKLLGERPL